MKIVRVTTEPTRQGRGGFLKYLVDAWQGSMDKESQVEPGEHVLFADAGFGRRQVEAMHNWALRNGFESELAYCRRPKAWGLRVRRPGDREPMFLDEQAAHVAAEIRADQGPPRG